MRKYIALSLAVVLSLSIGGVVPAFAKPIHKHHLGKYMAAHLTPSHRGGVAMPEQRPVSPTAQDAEEAIAWQNSLHGEID